MAVSSAPKPEFETTSQRLAGPITERTGQSPERLAAKPAEAPAPPRARGIFALQRSSQTRSLAIRGSNGRTGTASLTNLNTVTNAWFILTISGNMQGNAGTYHLENRDPAMVGISLADSQTGLLLDAGGEKRTCDLWSGAPSALQNAVASGLPYAPLCGGQLYLRNKVEGQYTDIELVTEFLRENVWSGEDIVGFVRDTIYQDAYRETGRTGTGDEAAPASSALGAPPETC